MKYIHLYERRREIEQFLLYNIENHEYLHVHKIISGVHRMQMVTAITTAHAELLVNHDQWRYHSICCNALPHRANDRITSAPC